MQLEIQFCSPRKQMEREENKGEVEGGRTYLKSKWASSTLSNTFLKPHKSKFIFGSRTTQALWLAQHLQPSPGCHRIWLYITIAPTSNIRDPHYAIKEHGECSMWLPQRQHCWMALQHYRFLTPFS